MGKQSFLQRLAKHTVVPEKKAKVQHLTDVDRLINAIKRCSREGRTASEHFLFGLMYATFHWTSNRSYEAFKVIVTHPEIVRATHAGRSYLRHIDYI